MARFVYIREICPDSWLIWTTKNQGSCLRDYRKARPEDHHLSTAQIKELLRKEGNHQETAPYVSVDNARFWQEQQQFRNIESGLKILTTRSRLLNDFKKHVGGILEGGNVKELRSEFGRWERIFCKIKRKKQFNHWDDDDATRLKCHDKGIGWTAGMLETCRAGRHPFFIGTGQSRLDFMLLAMELNLGISSKSNRHQPEERDFIKPDGLGVRQDGSFCVLEVKGPQDDGDLLKATLQGVCGALAVYAKRKMIFDLAKCESGRRPHVAVKEIPIQRRTLGVYVLMSSKDAKGRQKFKLEERVKVKCKLILQSFAQLSHIVYFSVSPGQSRDFSKLEISHCIELDGRT